MADALSQPDENGLDDNLQKTSGNGSGFKLGLNNTGGNHTVRYNLAWENGESGFDENNNDPTKPLTLYNNSTWANRWDGYTVNNAVANVLRDNFSGNPVGAHSQLNAVTVHDHNSFDSSPPVTVSAADFVSTGPTANTGARQADGSLPASNFLKLVAGSDLIDKGVNVGLPYSGSAPDLGAYELSAAPTPTPTPTPTPPPISPTAWYTVTNQNSGKCVEARGGSTSDGTVVQQFTCNLSSFAQQWQF